jgi:hypothetical protein
VIASEPIPVSATVGLNTLANDGQRPWKPSSLFECAISKVDDPSLRGLADTAGDIFAR